MTATKQVDLSELEARLGGVVPTAYRALVGSETPSALEARGFDPKTLLVLNLELRTYKHVECTGRFFLNGDGCGNYYFTELDAFASRVLLWSHDPPGIEDPALLLGPYFRETEQLCRIDWPPSPGRLYICRSDSYGESILLPIELADWIAAVEATDGIVHVGYRQGRNPFTGDTIRIDSPGLARTVKGERAYASFHYGRGQLDDCPEHRAIAVQLAEKLGAHVLSADAAR
ncbi:MAG TPA: hypothetical protein VER96_07075 [Polyangiaceae bacterium]|nr:hypothetical protein [Polyangiaceae bacterium]